MNIVIFLFKLTLIFQNNTNPWTNSNQILLQQLSSAAVAAAATRNHSLFSTDNEPWRTPFVLDPSITAAAAAAVDPQTAAAATAAMFYPIELGDSRMFGRINVPASTASLMRPSQSATHLVNNNTNSSSNINNTNNNNNNNNTNMFNNASNNR